MPTECDWGDHVDHAVRSRLVWLRAKTREGKKYEIGVIQRWGGYRLADDWRDAIDFVACCTCLHRTGATASLMNRDFEKRNTQLAAS